MSREIKFRAWKRSAKAMLIVGELIMFTDGDYLVNGEDPDVELMQFTGLKDKNGIEVYEGDLIKDCESDQVYEVVYDTKYNYPAFDVKPGEGEPGWGGDENAFSYMGEAGEGFEVVGNIFENPAKLNHKEN